MPLYAIGDIHGHTDQLDRALSLIDADGGAVARIVFLGDYVDRGPNGRGVIDRLMAGQKQGKDWICLMGNHDLMFWRFVSRGIWQDPHIKSGKGWLHYRLGGNTTLMSYIPDLNLAEGLDPVTGADKVRLQAAARAAVPQTHLDWIEHGPRHFQAEGHLFVHAGIRPGRPLAEQTEADLTWIREGWIDSDADHGQVVVHGHTMLDFPRHYGNRINLDGGAGQGRPLVPAVLDHGTWFTLDEAGRSPLTC